LLNELLNKAWIDGPNRGLPFDNDEWLVDFGEIGKAHVNELRICAHVNKYRIRISSQLGEGLFWRYISCVGHRSALPRTTAWAVTICSPDTTTLGDPWS
jgi:hypothetical protein